MISIVIDNHNRSYLLPLLMQSYNREEFKGTPVEMVIVDDSSEPRNHFLEYLSLGIDTIEPWFKVRAYRMPPKCSNMNVGKTLNIGVKQSKGDILILNHSDMIPLNRNILSLVHTEHSKTNLLYLTSRFISVDYPMRDVTHPEERDWILTPGSSMPRKLFYDVGGFDERFIGYGPVEPDFAFRVIYAPKTYGFIHKRSDKITYLHFKISRIPIRGGEQNPNNDRLLQENSGKVMVNPDGWGLCTDLEEVME